MKTFGKVWLGVSFIAIGIGIAILIIAFAAGANWSKVVDTSDFYTMNGSYDGVKSLNMDVDLGKVKIVEGEAFHLTAKNVIKGEVESYVKDGTWYIKEDDNRLKNLFGDGFKIEKFFHWDWNNHFTPDITVTVPKDFRADNCTIGVATGSLDADVVNAAVCDFHVDLGELDINQLTTSEKSKYKVGTGEMNIQNATVHDITVDCGVGDFDLEGMITGDSDVRCGIGNVDLSIDGEKEEYNYDIDCGIGDVDIDGESYKHIGNDNLHNNDADNSLHLDCGIGDISVDFK